MVKRWKLVLVCAFFGFLSGCGTGGGSPVVAPPLPPPPPQQQEVQVVVSPDSALIVLGGTQQFTATVANSSNTAVTWQVGGVTGGNETLGTISTNGLYTAPTSLPGLAVVSIKAIAAADSTKSGDASVSLRDPGNPHYIFVSSGPDDTIQVFTLAKGAAHPEAGPVISVGTGKNPVALAMHPNGKFLYSLNRGSNDISIFAIDRATGDLTPAGSALSADGPYEMVFSAAGDFAYVSCDTASAIVAFAVDTATGALTPVTGSPYALGSHLQGFALSSNGKFLYVTDPATALIIGLAVNSSDGSLSQIVGSPFTAEYGLASIIVFNGYAYAANRANGTVNAYSMDENSGLLGALGALESTQGSSPELFSSVQGGFLLGVNTGSDSFFSFEVPGEPYSYGPPVATGANPLPGGVLADQTYYPYVYVLNRGSDISAASIGVHYVSYAGASESIGTVPTASSRPTGFAVTPW